MVAIKVILILIILSGAIAAGSVYTIYTSPEFDASLRITSAEIWGSGIKASADLILVNKLGSDTIRITELNVKVFHPDEVNLMFLSKNLAPPIIELLPGETRVVEVKDIFIRDVEFIGSEVKIVVEGKYSVSPRDQPYSGIPVSFRVEKILNMASFLEVA